MQNFYSILKIIFHTKALLFLNLYVLTSVLVALVKRVVLDLGTNKKDNDSHFLNIYIPLRYFFYSHNYGCSYGAKFKFLYSEKMLFYSEKHFHIQRKLYYIQRNIFIFSVIFLCLKKFSIFREIAYLKKLFYIQRKFLYL